MYINIKNNYKKSAKANLRTLKQLKLPKTITTPFACVYCISPRLSSL